MRVLTLLLVVTIATFTAGCLSPVDAYVGGYVGPLSNVGSTESSFQPSVDAPVSAPVVVDVDSELDARFAVSSSGAADAIVSGLLEGVLSSAAIGLTPACHIPLSLREGRLVLDSPWPCDSSEIVEAFDERGSTRSTDIEVTVVDLVIEPGRGDAAVEVSGTVEVDAVTERRDVDRVQREFSAAVLSFTHLGRLVAQE